MCIKESFDILFLGGGIGVKRPQYVLWLGKYSMTKRGQSGLKQFLMSIFDFEG